MSTLVYWVSSPDEEPQKRVHIQIRRVEWQPIVDEGVREPVERDERKVSPCDGVAQQQREHGGLGLGAEAGAVAVAATAAAVAHEALLPLVGEDGCCWLL